VSEISKDEESNPPRQDDDSLNAASCSITDRVRTRAKDRIQRGSRPWVGVFKFAK
jgi:hypothetical protein